jgi:Relaxase/Mobilisation nuclease domain
MVAKITSPHSIKRALNYNEKKVQKEQASCIYAGNFLKDLDKLNFYSKLKRFEDLISLNDRAKKSNTLHISLNFDPCEKLDQKSLAAISASYMGKIGFGAQPYLVYEHKDAGHPHIHIVTTNIETSGKRIDTYNIGRLKSELARKEIEMEFSLIQAAGRNNQQPAFVREPKAEYGKSETKRAITNVLDHVINQYKYNSLASLNAVLKAFNIIADPGKDGGRIHKYNGLLFHILDQNGKKMGVPIKASSIYSKPTLLNLEKKFKENGEGIIPGRQKLKAIIDYVLLEKPESLAVFIRALGKQNIQTILRQNDKGFSFGITFIDHKNKTVFNGSEIGKDYSVAALQKCFGDMTSQLSFSRKKFLDDLKKPILSEPTKKMKAQDLNKNQGKGIASNDLIRNLLKSEELGFGLPYQLMPKKRKKKRKMGLKL